MKGLCGFPALEISITMMIVLSINNKFIFNKDITIKKKPGAVGENFHVYVTT